MRSRSRALAAVLLLATAAAACGNDHPTPAPPAATTSWRLDVAGDTAFGVRIWLDQEAIYEQLPPSSTSHAVAVARPYRAGEHLIEFEILSAASSPATYVATWTVQAKEDGPAFTADGVPTVLSVGDRLTVRVPL